MNNTILSQFLDVILIHPLADAQDISATEDSPYTPRIRVDDPAALEPYVTRVRLDQCTILVIRATLMDLSGTVLPLSNLLPRH